MVLNLIDHVHKCLQWPAAVTTMGLMPGDKRQRATFQCIDNAAVQFRRDSNRRGRSVHLAVS